MTPKVEELVSRRVREAPPAYFTRPPVPITYDFDQGVPAPELYPLEELARYAAMAIERFGPSSFAYVGGEGYEDLSYGSLGLRRVLADRLQQRQGRDLGPGGVMLFNGSAQGLATLAATFCEPGDGVAVEALSFPYMVGYLASTGAEMATVPVDGDGMDVDALEKVLDTFEERGVKPKLVYTIPTYQVPTGTCMPQRRREQLVELAVRRGVVVVEDNCYYDVYYEQPPPPTLLSLDESGLVVQSDSFSKILAPGLRMGWIAGVPEVMAAVAVARQDLGVSQWLARALELYVADGKLDAHIEVLRAAYRRKRDIALSALQEHCSRWVRFRVPEGGIYFWLEMSDDVDWDRVRELVAQEGVACRPGERFAGDDSGRRFLRMAYLQVPEEEIPRGVAALGRALAASPRRSTMGNQASAAERS
jgi:2-aminoadipate transaminase